MADTFQTALAVLASLGGGGVLVFALSSWLGKVWAERILAEEKHKYAQEIEALRSGLQKSRDKLNAQLEAAVHVNRAQFEVEFRALRAIWFRLIVLRNCVGALNQDVSIGPDNLDINAERRRRVQDLISAVARFFWVTHRNSPFVPKIIFEKLMTCLDIANMEEVNVRTYQNDFKRESRAEGRENRDKLIKAADSVSDEIRTRLASLSVT